MEIIEDLHTVRPCVLSHLIDVWAIVGGRHDVLQTTHAIHYKVLRQLLDER